VKTMLILDRNTKNIPFLRARLEPLAMEENLLRFLRWIIFASGLSRDIRL